MPLAYRAASYVSSGNASGGDLTLTKPVGTVDGDIVVIMVYFEPDTCTITVSPGTWETVTIANTGAFKLQAFVKRASSEPASYTIANDVVGNQWRAAAGVAYSGGTGSGTLIDVSGTAQGDAQAITLQNAPTVTTTGANRMLVFGYANFSGTNPTSLTGVATNLRGTPLGSVTIGDVLRASSGATGTSRPNAGPGTDTWAALHVAIISDTGGGGVTVDAASVPASAAGSAVNPTVVQASLTLNLTSAVAAAVSSAVTPTVRQGSVTVNASAVVAAAVGTAISPTVVQGSLTVNAAAGPATAVSAAVTPTVTLTGGGVTVTLTSVPASATSSAVTPSVVQSSIVVAPAASIAVSSAITPTVRQASLSVNLAALPALAIGSAIAPTTTVAAAAQRSTPMASGRRLLWPVMAARVTTLPTMSGRLGG